MAINLVTKYSDKVAERFKKASLTGGAASAAYEFSGVKTVKVFSVDTAQLNDYNRSGTSRYGTPNELGDTIQELSMTQDKGFTFTIDKGNAEEQLNVKAATQALRRQIDEVVIPTMDKYRFSVWCRKAGTIKGLAAAPNKNTVTGLIMDSTEVLDDALVPEAGRTLFVVSSVYKALKENPDFISVDALGEKALAKGQVGEIDGMKVIKVPASYLPTGVYWLITYKSAILAPAKLQDYKIHKDPPGINGDLVEGRIMHDAFVIGAKAYGIYAAVAAANVSNYPVATENTTASTVNLASNTSNAKVYYTTDGSDPRYSDTVEPYTADINYSGWTSGNYSIKSYAEDYANGVFASNVVTTAVTKS